MSVYHITVVIQLLNVNIISSTCSTFKEQSARLNRKTTSFPILDDLFRQSEAYLARCKRALVLYTGTHQKAICFQCISNDELESII